MNRMLRYCLPLILFALMISLSTTLSAQSVARLWNEALLNAIRIDFPAPTVHSRNLYHTSAAMYDAWACFEPNAEGLFYLEKHIANDVPVARREAISYAAYRVLSHRYQLAVDPEASQALFDNLMSSLGYDSTVTTTEGESPAAIGNRIAQLIISSSQNDGSNESFNYQDPTGYDPVNEPMIVDYPDVLPPNSDPLDDPNAWQPLFIDSAVTQNGQVGTDLQEYIGPHWGFVTTFALASKSGPNSWSDIDPGPPPLLGGDGDQQYRDDAVLLIQYSNALDPFEGPGTEIINISPNTQGNRPLGTHDDQGYPFNPITGKPYEDNFVKSADYGRILAEYWADGPESETPPGHWNLIANEVADDPRTIKRIAGQGPVVDDLEWDVKVYLALNGATHDAAVAGWGVKREYDYVRPITMIRFQGSLGQASDPGLPSYNEDGLPLIPDLIELITAKTISPGGRHRNVYDNANQDSDGNFLLIFTPAQLVGKVAVKSWNHEPEDPENEVSGIDWILAQNWVPYQDDNFVTPAFAAYVSGHSTFSRASAEILSLMTGDSYFPGGLGEREFSVDFLDFEDGPTEPVTLQWATYYDAADEAGISRLWGGIHIPADDFEGRIMGSAIGMRAFEKAESLFLANLIRGDLNGDQEVTLLDVAPFVDLLVGGGYSLNADFDNDGAITPTDVQPFVDAIIGF